MSAEPTETEIQQTPEVGVGILSNFNLQDAKVMMQVIDQFIERGSMKGEEALPVGILRKKLTDALTKAGYNGEKK